MKNTFFKLAILIGLVTINSNKLGAQALGLVTVSFMNTHGCSIDVVYEWLDGNNQFIAGGTATIPGNTAGLYTNPSPANAWDFRIMVTALGTQPTGSAWGYLVSSSTVMAGCPTPPLLCGCDAGTYFELDFSTLSGHYN